MTIDYRNNAAERIVQALKSPDEMQAQTVALIAQAEATLALVEQQRIANLTTAGTCTALAMTSLQSRITRMGASDA